MRTSTVMILLSVTSLFGGEDVHLGPAVTTTIPLASAQPAETAELRVIEGAVSIAAKGTLRGHLYAIFDARSRRFWWTFSNEWRSEAADTAAKMFVKEYRMAEDDSRIVGFTANGRNLWYRLSNHKADSMEAGIQTAAAVLPAECAKFADGSSLWFEPLNLSLTLGLEFFRSNESENSRPGILLLEVRPSVSGWELKLESERGQIATIAVDKSFQRAIRTGR